MKHEIFISYSHKDIDKVKLIEKELENHPILKPLVIAANREPLKPLTEKVTNGIKSAVVIIPIITKRSITEQWINQEIGFATALKKTIMPIIDNTLMDNLKGFIHKQIDLPYPYDSSSVRGQEDRNFVDCLKKLLMDIEKNLDTILKSQNGQLNSWDQEWLTTQREHTSEKMNKLGINIFQEIMLSPVKYTLSLNRDQLLKIAEDSQISTMGWPIAPIFNPRTSLPNLRTTFSKADGVLSEISDSQGIYDYSYFRQDGKIYLLSSLSESVKIRNSIDRDWRINRTTELFLYCQKFYKYANLPPSESINIRIKYSGLKGKCLNMGLWNILPQNDISDENELVIELNVTLDEISNRLTELIDDSVNRLFSLFNFKSVPFTFVENLVKIFIESSKKKHYL